MQAKFILSALSLAVAAAANAVVIDFEGHESDTPLASTYAAQGVTFTSGSFLGPDYNSGGYPPHSGTCVAYGGGSSTIGGTMDAPSADFSIWFSTPDGYSVTFQLFDGGSEVANASYSGIYSSSQNASISGVTFDSFVITGQPGFFTVDDLSYTNAVPEPASMAALGLGGLALLRRRRKA